MIEGQQVRLMIGWEHIYVPRIDGYVLYSLTDWKLLVAFVFPHDCDCSEGNSFIVYNCEWLEGYISFCPMTLNDKGSICPVTGGLHFVLPHQCEWSAAFVFICCVELYHNSSLKSLLLKLWKASLFYIQLKLIYISLQLHEVI